MHLERGLKWSAVVFSLVAVIIIQSCGTEDEQLSSVITIISPFDMDTVADSWIEVSIAINNFDTEAEDHFITYHLNEKEEEKVNDLSFTVSGLIKGLNTIRVDLVGNGQLRDSDEVKVYAPMQSETNSVVVINGDGNGIFETGSTVEIAAYAKDIPYVFAHWQGDTGFLVDSTLSPTFFIMPAQSVRLEAVYRVDSSFFHDLRVTYGTGSGKYLPGQMVEVGPDMEDPLVFTHWSGGNGFLEADSLSGDLIFEMPAMDVDLEAKWKVENVSFRDHLYPILELNCNDAGCHGANGSPAYLTHDAIAADGQSIVAKTQSGNMPPPTYGQLSDEELEIIRVWVEEGMLDN